MRRVEYHVGSWLGVAVPMSTQALAQQGTATAGKTVFASGSSAVIIGALT